MRLKSGFKNILRSVLVRGLYKIRELRWHNKYRDQHRLEDQGIIFSFPTI
jgi:hypothetical protein